LLLLVSLVHHEAKRLDARRFEFTAKCGRLFEARFKVEK